MVQHERNDFGLFSYAGDVTHTHPLESIEWRCAIGDACHAQVKQSFVNTTTQAMDVTYVFPLLPGATVCGAEVCIADRPPIPAHVVAKQAADEQYQQAVNAGHSALMVELCGGDVLRLKLGLLPAGTRALITLDMVLVCDEQPPDGALRIALPVAIGHRYPLLGDAADRSKEETEEASAEMMAVAEGARGPGHAGFGLRVDVEMPSAIVRVTSPCAALCSTINAQDPRRAIATLTTPTMPDDEIVLTFELHDARAPRCYLEPFWPRVGLAGVTPGEVAAAAGAAGASDPEAHPRDEHVAALVVLPLDAPALLALSGAAGGAASSGDERFEFIFLIDRSNSMDWRTGHDSEPPIRRAAAALQLFLRSLPPHCRLNIVSFGSQSSSLWPAPMQYSEATLQEASAHAGVLRADMGGTELLRPLTQILAHAPPDGYERRVVVLTDGAVSNTDGVLRHVRARASECRTRILTVGIGSQVSHALVDGLADAGGGSAEYVAIGERMEPKVIRQLRRALAPPPPTLEYIEWVGDEWTAIARGDGGAGGAVTHEEGSAGGFEMVDVADAEPFDAPRPEPMDLSMLEEHSSATVPAGKITTEYLAATGGDGRRAEGLASTERLSIRCGGQRIVIAALLRASLHVHTLRLHFVRDGVRTHLDVPTARLARGRRLHAAVGRVLVSEVDASSAPPAARASAIEAIGVALQLVTRRTSLVAIDHGTQHAVASQRATVSANAGARYMPPSDHTPRSSGFGGGGEAGATELTDEQLAQFKEAFSLADRSGAGSVGAQPLGAAMRSLGHQSNDSEMNSMLASIGIGAGGSVDFDAFCTLMARKMHRASKERQQTACDGDGFVSAAELRHVLSNLGAKLTNEQFDALVGGAGAVDGTGSNNYHGLLQTILSGGLRQANGYGGVQAIDGAPAIGSTYGNALKHAASPLIDNVSDAPVYRSLAMSAAVPPMLQAPTMRALSAPVSAPLVAPSTPMASHAENDRAGDNWAPLVLLQGFDGAWQFDERLACALGRSLDSLSPPAGIDGRPWATALALAYLEDHGSAQSDEWALVADKARAWLHAAGQDPTSLVETARQHMRDAVRTKQTARAGGKAPRARSPRALQTTVAAASPLCTKI